MNDADKPQDTPGARPAYEPPKLTITGNIHDLLAGDAGTVEDVDPSAIAKRSSAQGP